MQSLMRQRRPFFEHWYKAKYLARSTLSLRPQPEPPYPFARQYHAEASDDMAARKTALNAMAVKIFMTSSRSDIRWYLGPIPLTSQIQFYQHSDDVRRAADELNRTWRRPGHSHRPRPQQFDRSGMKKPRRMAPGLHPICDLTMRRDQKW